MEIKIIMEFSFFQKVYLKTDIHQFERMVTGVSVQPSGTVSYGLSCGEALSYHYAEEISATKNILINSEEDY